MTGAAGRQPALLEEARRQLDVCNACRYCEGYCAVFPALERRAILLDGDLAQLANLCHDCRACLQACMYAPPHEFGVDIPALLTRARLESYERFAWPRSLGRAYRHSSLAIAGATALGIALSLAAAALAGAGLVGTHTGPGAFYAVVPYAMMLVPALVLSAFAILVLLAGSARLWLAAGGRPGDLAKGTVWLTAAREATTLRWLSGAGAGCYHPDPDRPSGTRRALHLTMVGGLALAFAATVVAAVLQDVLGLLPPYPLLSGPVLLGAAGGIATIAGCTGLLALRAGTARSNGLDVAFLVALDAAAATGMLTLALRSTPLLGIALALHLGSLAGIYLTAPYAKLVHAAHRFAALLRDVAERAGEK